MDKLLITEEDLKRINTKKGYLKLLKKKDVNLNKILANLKYQDELEQLQIELIKMQTWVVENGLRVAIVFEGRDAAGKGGTIRRFVEHLNPRSNRIVALPKPTEDERRQWYFRRYINHLPNAGEITFFDRSWYNRAVVEPVNGFCTEEQYERFMNQVNDVERMLRESGITLFKFWLDTSKEEQAARFDERRKSPLKQWKLSPIDAKAQELWDVYTQYRNAMFKRTHTEKSPWIVVQADHKKSARLESIRYVLQQLEYTNKDKCMVNLSPDPKIIQKYDCIG